MIGCSNCTKMERWIGLVNFRITFKQVIQHLDDTIWLANVPAGLQIGEVAAGVEQYHSLFLTSL